MQCKPENVARMPEIHERKLREAGLEPNRKKCTSFLPEEAAVGVDPRSPTIMKHKQDVREIPRESASVFLAEAHTHTHTAGEDATFGPSVRQQRVDGDQDDQGQRPNMYLCDVITQTHDGLRLMASASTADWAQGLDATAGAAQLKLWGTEKSMARAEEGAKALPAGDQREMQICSYTVPVEAPIVCGKQTVGLRHDGGATAHDGNICQAVRGKVFETACKLIYADPGIVNDMVRRQLSPATTNGRVRPQIG